MSRAALVRPQLATVVLAVLMAACSGSTANGPTGSIIIHFPERGSTVASSPIAVGGTVPAGTRVVHDIPSGLDDVVVAGSDGRWQFLVELEEGVNDLVFRIGDDESTEVHFTLTYQPEPGPVST